MPTQDPNTLGVPTLKQEDRSLLPTVFDFSSAATDSERLENLQQKLTEVIAFLNVLEFRYGERFVGEMLVGLKLFGLTFGTVQPPNTQGVPGDIFLDYSQEGQGDTVRTVVQTGRGYEDDITAIEAVLQPLLNRIQTLEASELDGQALQNELTQINSDFATINQQLADTLAASDFTVANLFASGSYTLADLRISDALTNAEIATEIMSASDAIQGGAPTDADTLGKLNTLLIAERSRIDVLDATKADAAQVTADIAAAASNVLATIRAGVAVEADDLAKLFALLVIERGRIDTQVARVDNILGGADAARDTFAEISALLDAEDAEDAATVAALMTSIGQRLAATQPALITLINAAGGDKAAIRAALETVSLTDLASAVAGLQSSIDTKADQADVTTALDGKQDVLSGTQGQRVGFDASGNPIAEDVTGTSQPRFDNLSDFLASTDTFSVGDKILAGNRTYEIADPGDVDPYLQTAGGFDVRLVGAALDFDNLHGTLCFTNDFIPRDLNVGHIPPSTPYYNVLLTPDGPDKDDTIWRTNCVGWGILSRAEHEIERVDALGDGALRFADYLDSVTAIGSLSHQWLGMQQLPGETLSQALVRLVHEFVRVDGARELTDPAWDAFGLETRTPGIRAEMAAVTTATHRSDNDGNVGVGRNSNLHMIKGTDNVAIGRNTMAHAFYNTGVTAVGRGAFIHGALINRSQALGRAAGNFYSRGQGSTFIGHRAGHRIASGDFNMILGDDAVAHLTGEVNNLLAIAMGDGSVPLLSGDFATGVAGINVNRDDNKSIGLHVRTSEVVGGSANIGARGLVLERAGASHGMTILTDNNRTGSLNFADPEDNNDGFIRYSHANREISIGAANATRLNVTINGVRLVNPPTSPAGLTTGDLWVDTADDNTVKAVM